MGIFEGELVLLFQSLYQSFPFDQQDLERSMIGWERLIQRLKQQHKFTFEDRQLYAMLIRGLPEDLRLTMNREGVLDFTTLKKRVVEYCRNKRLSDPVHSDTINEVVIAPVTGGRPKGNPWKGRGKGKTKGGKSKKSR